MKNCLQVDRRINGLADSAVISKAFSDEHVEKMYRETNDSKRKWEDFSKQAENDCVEGSKFSSAKHCRMELLLQQWSVTIFFFEINCAKIRKFLLTFQFDPQPFKFYNCSP